MILDTIYYTRTDERDYEWKQKPSYLDRTAGDELRPLFKIAENSANSEYLLKKGRRNLYIIPGRNYILLCYIYLTKRKDQFGRAISAVEGFSCRKEGCDLEQLRDFIMLLLHDLLNPDNKSGIRFYTADRDSLPKNIDYKPTAPLSGKELDDLEVEIMSWGYGNFIGAVYRELEQYGLSRKIILATEKEDFYQLSDAKYFHVYTWVDFATKLEAGEFYHTPETPDRCRLQFYLEKDAQTERYSLSAMLAGDDFNWGSFRDICSCGRDEEPGIPLYAVYRHFYTCQQALRKCAIEITGGESLEPSHVPSEEFFTLSEQIHELDYRDTYRFEIQDMDRKADPDLYYRQPHEQAIIDWYRVSRRFGARYYANGGQDTLFVINLDSGLWVFRYIREANGTVSTRGIAVGEEDRTRAYRRIEDILQMDRRISRAGLQLSPEYEKQLRAFREAAQAGQVRSAVISAVIPKDCRGGSPIDYFGPDNHRVQIDLNDLIGLEKPDTWKINPDMCRNLYLAQVASGMFRKKREWSLLGKAPYLSEGADDYTSLLYTDTEDRLPCIDEEGTFRFEEMDVQVTRLVRERNLEYFYQCPVCRAFDIRVQEADDGSGKLLVCRKCRHERKAKNVSKKRLL